MELSWAFLWATSEWPNTYLNWALVAQIDGGVVTYFCKLLF